MATTPEQSKQNQEDFAAAFNGEEPVRPQKSEDEEFGLSEEPGPTEEEVMEADGGADEATESAQEAAAESTAESAADGQAGNDEQGAAPAIVIAVEPGSEAMDEPTDPKDVQRAKSWEGRLKAREEELKAREEALKAREGAQHNEAAEPAADEAAEPAVVEALEDAADKVESGEMTAEQAMQTLTLDLGPEFTKMLSVLIEAKAGEIAGKLADEKMGQVNQKLDGIVGEIVDDKARQHFESIADAHPDFMDVAKSPEFKAYIDAMDETAKADAMQTIEAGSSRQIIKLLNGFKDAAKPQEQAEQPPAEVDESAMDAAEGVRSSGLKLPEKPAAAQDYEEAWNQF